MRTFVTVVAGVTRMERRRFFLWSAVGAVLWVGSILLLGYTLGQAFPSLGENIDKALIAILAFTVIPIAWGGCDTAATAATATAATPPSCGRPAPPSPARRPETSPLLAGPRVQVSPAGRVSLDFVGVETPTKSRDCPRVTAWPPVPDRSGEGQGTGAGQAPARRRAGPW